MKTIKIIDLLNKIANGEKIPIKIKYSNKIFEWYKWNIDLCDYVYSGSEGLLNSGEYDLFAILNNEVEIIEEEIKQLELNTTLIVPTKNESNITDNLWKVARKLNEVIDALNELNKNK